MTRPILAASLIIAGIALLAFPAPLPFVSVPTGILAILAGGQLALEDL
jgi:hypothetical protein